MAKETDPSEPFHVHRLDNGMVVLVEPMAGVSSAAMELHVPTGSATDPADRCGITTVLAELVLRGAGDRDAKQLTDHLDTLGLWRGGGAGTLTTRFSAAGLAWNVLEGLAAHADIVRRPRLRDEDVQPSVDLARQALVGLVDNPQQLATTKLRQFAWPSPFSRNPMGELAHLDKLSTAGLREDFGESWQPGGAVLSIAGDVDSDDVIEMVTKLFGDWKPIDRPALELTAPAGPTHYIEQDSQQTHIALAYPTIPETHDDYYVARLAVECLSGGMSGRLFDRIREKQGLCYSVYAGYTSMPVPGGNDFASVFAYAGTSNERAQQTLDALVHELRDIASGVRRDELHRAKIGLKAGTVMSGESSSARASGLARDWLSRGRCRTLDEIVAAVDAIDLDRLNTWLAANPASGFTIVQIGPRELDVTID
ncbi:MAG: pitrilysin family protein [Planctomycetota bacterium]